MTISKVYFSDLRTSVKENLPSKLKRLMQTAGINDVVAARNLAAIKLHFGEKGNTAFIRPLLIRAIVEQINDLGASPFLTDANTLYAGSRGDSIDHLKTAIENGFAYSVVNAPIIIADGIRGASFSKIRIDQEIIKSAYIGQDIVESDVLVSVAHFKGHELSGSVEQSKISEWDAQPGKGNLNNTLTSLPKSKEKMCRLRGLR